MRKRLTSSEGKSLQMGRRLTSLQGLMWNLKFFWQSSCLDHFQHPEKHWTLELINKSYMDRTRRKDKEIICWPWKLCWSLFCSQQRVWNQTKMLSHSKKKEQNWRRPSQSHWCIPVESHYSVVFDTSLHTIWPLSLLHKKMTLFEYWKLHHLPLGLHLGRPPALH